jgi:hypothetical protein
MDGARVKVAVMRAGLEILPRRVSPLRTAVATRCEIPRTAQHASK